jgi:hypothetical protein
MAHDPRVDEGRARVFPGTAKQLAFMNPSFNLGVPSVIPRFTRGAALLAFATLGLFSAASTAFGLPAHVVVVIMENHSFNEIIGSPNAPYINNTLAANGAVLTNHHAIEHPSQPNYLDLFSGSNQGSHDDATLLGTPLSTPNLGALLLAKASRLRSFRRACPLLALPAIAPPRSSARTNMCANIIRR